MDSSIFFYNFVERNNIVLDYNYDKIVYLYNNKESNINYGDYVLYFDIFINFNEIKEKVYILYYILILFLINDEHLKNFCRYIISIYSRFSLIDNNLDKYKFKDMTKEELLKLLYTIVNFHDVIIPNKITNKINKKTNCDVNITKFFIFILCFQSYF